MEVKGNVFRVIVLTNDPHWGVGTPLISESFKSEFEALQAANDLVDALRGEELPSASISIKSPNNLTIWSRGL